MLICNDPAADQGNPLCHGLWHDCLDRLDRLEPLRTAATYATTPPLTGQIDRIEIDKSDRLLTVFRGDDALRSYDIALGFSPKGDKFREGDGKTPEGTFTINRRNPESAFHLSLGIDYPQAEDTARANAADISPGGDIFIHGQPNKFDDEVILSGDWTAGCIALSNTEVRELWRITPNGTVVVIRP